MSECRRVRVRVKKSLKYTQVFGPSSKNSFWAIFHFRPNFIISALGLREYFMLWAIFRSLLLGFNSIIIIIINHGKFFLNYDDVQVDKVSCISFIC